MIMNEIGMQLDERLISQFEKRLNIKLPNDYKEFMLKHNGGVPEKDWVFDFVEEDQETSSLLAEFYVIYAEKTYEEDDLGKAYIMLREQEEIPLNVLPIAADPGGNIVALSTADEDYGKVYFWDHETGQQDSSYSNMSLIADSFSEFIDKCHEYIEEE